MGDFYKQGKGARLVANVFDVKTGSRLRSATSQATDADSMLALFGPLARGALDVPPPLDGKLGAPGTTRLDAYQAYLEGVRALYRFELPAARAGLRRALTLDSTFALAHHHLAMVQEFSERAEDRDTARVHEKAAQAYGASLPARERTLIAAAVAATSDDYNRACELLFPLVQRDSADVLALYAFGDCAFHDGTVIPAAADSAPGRYRWGWNSSLRALSRVLDLDHLPHGVRAHSTDSLDIRSTGMALAARRRNPGIGCGAPPYPVPHVSAVRAHLQQPDHGRQDRRAVLHAALRLRLHPPPWMAGLAMAAFAHERLSQERRRLPAAIEARGRR